LPFSAEGFCKKLNGRSILLVGDSLLYSFYVAMKAQIGAKHPYLGQWTLRDVSSLEDPKNYLLCDSGGSAYFVRNDHWQVSGNDDIFLRYAA
jgi:hypothetical protein